MLILPGTVEQLVIAFVVSLAFMLISSVAAPFRDSSDEHMAKACAFSLVAVFFFSVILKVSVLAEEVDGVLTQRLRERFNLDVVAVTGCMLCSVGGALLLGAAMAAGQLSDAAMMPVIRLQENNAAPELALARGHRWHLFLSHIWSTGQDQCATIKRQLCLLLPGVSIFLDVDDLKDIGALEKYVNQTAVMMIFVSKGYFKSKNCLREVEHGVTTEKPLTLVHDPVKGGETLAVLKADECPDALRDLVFGHRDVIEWHRIKDFQLVSLKLLAEQLLLGCPSYAGRRELPLYVPGEITRDHDFFSAPVKLYASPNNPGAADVAKRLVAGAGGCFYYTEKTPAVLADRSSSEKRESSGRGSTSSRRRSSLAVSLFGDLGREREMKPTHMLLYLNDQTFLDEKGERLADEVRRARALNSDRTDANDLQIVMLHENDPAKGGCEFGRFFETTPGDLIAGGLYKALALASYPGAFWPVSVALVAQALGASESRLSVVSGSKRRRASYTDPFKARQHALGMETQFLPRVGDKKAAAPAAAVAVVAPAEGAAPEAAAADVAMILDEIAEEQKREGGGGADADSDVLAERSEFRETMEATARGSSVKKDGPGRQSVLLSNAPETGEKVDEAAAASAPASAPEASAPEAAAPEAAALEAAALVASVQASMEDKVRRGSALQLPAPPDELAC